MTEWTLFWDMHSGGGTKFGDYEEIYVEGAYEDAMRRFRAVTGCDPYNVTCECCGEDYAVITYDSIEDATAHDRNGALDEYLALPTVFVVRAPASDGAT
jgi:hypothetical protein